MGLGFSLARRTLTVSLSFCLRAQQVPRKIRVQISRRRNDDEDAEEDLYSYVTVADTPEGFSGLGTKVVDDA
jgi:hypothetical protein